MTILDHHSLGDDDAFIIVSRAKGSDDAVIHVHGQIGEILKLLSLAAEAIDEQEAPVKH